MRIREFRLVPALLALPAMLVLSAGTADAAGGGVAQVTGAQLRYTAAAGDANNIIISNVGGVHFVSDNVRIVPGPGCAYVTPNNNTTVACPGTGTINLLIINAGDGNDQVDNATNTQSIMTGSDGHDLMFGGDNVDQMIGDAGNDELRGAPGNDVLTGSTGDDRLIGNPGDDSMSGGAGNDTMRGDDGRDSMSGGTGNDSLRGENGDDTLNGDAGNDTLDGGSGINRLDGGTYLPPGGDNCVNGPTIINCNP